MKKGLLSILALAVTIVGCQNYDDQFDALNTQITALKSQIDGLAAVQSAVTALQGQLASLSSAALTSADLDAALSSGLADIISDVEAVQAAVADVASAADVTAVSDALTDAQTDLDELLAQSSVFTGDVNVTSESTLDAFLAMGSSLNIVNGNVTITPTAGMDQARVQELVDNIITVIKDFTYTAPSSDYAQTTFTALTGVQTLTLKQGGGYDARNLTSAAKIVLDNTYKSTVTLVHLGALTTVTTIQDEDGPAGTVNLNKVEEFHLTSLARYPGNNLNITTKEGSILDISSLTDQDADGDAVGAGYSLTIDGPASISLSTITDGTISLTNVATASISGFIGNSDINAGVVNLTIDGAVDLDISGAADLETASITGALDSDSTLATADTAGPNVVFASQDLVTATVAGVVNNVTASAQSNLETLTVSADMKGATLDVSGNGDLVTLTVTGAKIGDVIVHDNDDLETVTLDHTTALKTGIKGVTAKITDNANLTNVRYSADKVDTLNVSDNAQLETIDFTGLATVGTATSVTVDVKDNKLTSTLAKDAFDAASATTDSGSYTSSSGMATLKTYLTAANAVATRDIEVYFDVLEQVQTQASATANYADISHTDATTGTGRNAVLVVTTTPASGVTIRETVTTVFPAVKNALDAGVQNLDVTSGSEETIAVTAGGLTTNYAANASGRSTIAQLVSYINADTSFGSNFDVTAAQDAYKQSVQQINYFDSDGSTAATVNTAGNLYFTFGTISGTIAVAAADTADDIASAIAGQISGGTPNLYNADGDTVSGEILISRTVSVAGYPSDRSPAAGSIPTLSFTIDAAQTSTTAVLSNNASNTAGASSDYFLNVIKNDLTGLRITVKNNSTSAAGSMSVGVSNGGTAIGTASAALASGTNMVKNTSLVAAFADISTATPASTSSTSRLGWL